MLPGGLSQVRENKLCASGCPVWHLQTLGNTRDGTALHSGRLYFYQYSLSLHWFYSCVIWFVRSSAPNVLLLKCQASFSHLRCFGLWLLAVFLHPPTLPGNLPDSWKSRLLYKQERLFILCVVGLACPGCPLNISLYAHTMCNALWKCQALCVHAVGYCFSVCKFQQVCLRWVSGRDPISAAEGTLGLGYFSLKKVVTDRLVTKKCPDRDSRWARVVIPPSKTCERLRRRQDKA